jgi:hypothetical protein
VATCVAFVAHVCCVVRLFFPCKVTIDLNLRDILGYGMSPYHFEAFACLEFVAFGTQWISLIEHSCSSFCSYCFFCLCAGEDIPPSSGDADEGCQ